MSEKLALVTGGARGIGREISIALKNAGYDVAATYCRNKEEADAFTAEFGVQTFAWDVSDFDQCKNGIKTVEEHFGRSVDILVNNAGITADRMMQRQVLQGLLRIRIRTHPGAVPVHNQAVSKHLRR